MSLQCTRRHKWQIRWIYPNLNLIWAGDKSLEISFELDFKPSVNVVETWFTIIVSRVDSLLSRLDKIDQIASQCPRWFQRRDKPVHMWLISPWLKVVTWIPELSRLSSCCSFFKSAPTRVVLTFKLWSIHPERRAAVDVRCSNFVTWLM